MNVWLSLLAACWLICPARAPGLLGLGAALLLVLLDPGSRVLLAWGTC